jgi:hypothetical protein
MCFKLTVKLIQQVILVFLFQVKDAVDINDKSLELFTLLEPKIGKDDVGITKIVFISAMVPVLTQRLPDTLWFPSIAVSGVAPSQPLEPLGIVIQNQQKDRGGTEFHSRNVDRPTLVLCIKILTVSFKDVVLRRRDVYPLAPHSIHVWYFIF